MSREIWLEKLYFRRRINTGYRKLLLKLKVDEKLKQKIILNIKISGKGLSKRHISVFLSPLIICCFIYFLIFLSLGEKTSCLQLEIIFVIFLSLWTLMWPVLRLSSDEYGDSNPAGLSFPCHISPAFDCPQISLSFHFLKCCLSSTTHQRFLLTRVANSQWKINYCKPWIDLICHYMVKWISAWITG
jgi:hypothetical protein